MMTKPLYLDHSPLNVQLEGPALRVFSENKAERLYPLRYIERVQCHRGVQWQTQALLACAGRGIPVQFITGGGDSLATLVGQVERQHSLVGQLEHALSMPGWEKRYQCWRHGRRLQTLRYVAVKLGFAFKESRELDNLPGWYDQRLPEWVKQQRTDRQQQWLYSDYQGFITGQLRNRGIVNDNLLLLHPLNLVKDLTHILGPLLLMVHQRGVMQLNHRTTISRLTVANWFSDNRSFLKYQFERMVNLLELWTYEDN
jgi:hypothetical protein